MNEEKENSGLPTLNITLEPETGKCSIATNVTDYTTQMALYKGATIFAGKFARSSLLKRNNENGGEVFEDMDKVTTDVAKGDAIILTFKELVDGWINDLIENEGVRNALGKNFNVADIRALFMYVFSGICAEKTPKEKLNEKMLLGHELYIALCKALDDPNIDEIIQNSIHTMCYFNAVKDDNTMLN